MGKEKNEGSTGSGSRLKIWWPAAAWLMLITVLSVIPGSQLPKFALFSIDKLGHAAVYAILSWLCLRAAQVQGLGRSAGLAVFGFATMYGILMEFVQYTFVPGRFYEYDDMLANAIGAGLGWLIFGLFRKKPAQT